MLQARCRTAGSRRADKAVECLPLCDELLTHRLISAIVSPYGYEIKRDGVCLQTHSSNEKGMPFFDYSGTLEA